MVLGFEASEALASKLVALVAGGTSLLHACIHIYMYACKLVAVAHATFKPLVLHTYQACK